MSIERPAIVNAHGVIQALVDYQAEHDRVVQENRTLRTRIANLEGTSVHPDILKAVFPNAVDATSDAVVHAIERLKSAAVGADLVGAIARMNDVITAQIVAVGATSGIAKAADIRRRQVAKYSPEHDRAHGPWELANAAIALLKGNVSHWPWDADGFYRILAEGDRQRLAHAAALCAAEYDARVDG